MYRFAFKEFNQLGNLYGYVMHKPSLLGCKLAPTTNLVTHVDSQCPFDSTLSRGDTKQYHLFYYQTTQTNEQTKNIPFCVPLKQYKSVPFKASINKCFCIDPIET